MNAQALNRIVRARSILIQENPFFGVLSMRLTLVERPDVGTAATDGANLFYAPEFVMSLTEKQLLGVLAHEIMHCALQHMTRLGGRDMKRANEAADYAINPELIRMRFELPAGILYDPKYADMGFEEIYAARERERRKGEGKKQAQAGQSGAAGQSGQSGQGGQQPAASGQQGGKPGNPGASAGQAPSGGQDGTQAPGAGNGGHDGQASATGAPSGQPGASGGHGAPGNASGAEINGMGGIMRPGDGSEAAAQEMADQWQVWTRQAAATAAKQAGDMPGMFKRILAEIGAPRVDYRQELADFIDSRVATDYSFNRPNRRFLHAGLILPGATVDGLEHLIFAVDTSGSIDAHMLEQAAAEIVGAVDDGKVERVTILFCDTAIRGVQEFERGDDIASKLDARGGGGTRFSPVFDWIVQNAPDATAAIFLTDMENQSGDWAAVQDPALPVLWAIHGTRAHYDRVAGRAPFGQTAYVGMLE